MQEGETNLKYWFQLHPLRFLALQLKQIPLTIKVDFRKPGGSHRVFV